MTSETIDNVLGELRSFYEDVKAEIILAELEKTTNTKVPFLTKNQGVFKRGFRRDVLKARKTNNNQLLLELSRLGIYDSLPESFFHESKKETTSSFNSKRQVRKKEEKDSRLFFAPIENELFTQSINLYKKEQELLDNFYEINSEFLLSFWDLKTYKNNKYIIQLAKLLPHSHKIAGDLNSAKYCLENILKEKVEFKKGFNSTKTKIEKGNSILGVDFTVTSEKSSIATPFLEIKIGPISNSKLNKYYENKEITDFLELFCSYFLPLELEIRTKLFNNKERNFILNEKETPIMGVSTKI